MDLLRFWCIKVPFIGTSSLKEVFFDTTFSQESPWNIRTLLQAAEREFFYYRISHFNQAGDPMMATERWDPHQEQDTSFKNDIFCLHSVIKSTFPCLNDYRLPNFRESHATVYVWPFCLLAAEDCGSLMFSGTSTQRRVILWVSMFSRILTCS